MRSLLKTDGSRKGLIKLDSRTILVLLVIGNTAVFLTPSMTGEILLTGYALTLALLAGVYRFSLKMMVAYLILLSLDYFMMMYAGGEFAQTVALGARYIRKIFPCAILGSILVLSVQVSEFMAALGKLRIPKTILIPLTIMLRYLPAVGEDRRQIKKALQMRDITPGIVSFIKHPARTVECIYVPLLMSGSRRAEELSAAAVTRGIENPKSRTSIHDVRFRLTDSICAAVSVAFIAFVLRF